MPLSQFVPIGFIAGGFLFAAVISERSLRGVDETMQGRLLKGTSLLRKIHLGGIPVVLLSAYFFPAVFWPGLVGYFAAATLLVAKRLSTLDLPEKLKRWQVASVAAIFIAASLGWFSSWLL
jgi:cytochrome bd-type quinol oxidase subunit 1